MNILKLQILILVSLMAGCGPAKKKTDSEEPVAKKDSVAEQRFNSNEFEMVFNYPENWKAEVFEIGNNQSVINIFPVSAADSVDLPLNIHEDAGYSYISLFPDGFGTEFPSGRSRSLKNRDELPVAFDLNMHESLAFFLENNQVWGYFLVPSRPPASWSSNGFIFAQAAVSDFEIKCFDKETGKELEMPECDPLMGDTVKRYGNVNQEQWSTINDILQSIEFQVSNNEEQVQSSDTVNTMVVTKPQPGTTISSPLEIKGKAKGPWFFEAVIEIELRKDGSTLASTTGKAQGNWMTNDFVDFSSRLEFPQTNETGIAELVFRNSNPSGKEELEKLFKVPVVIGK